MSTTIKINAGDTLTSVSKKTGIPVPVLMTVNGIADANKIRAGQMLTIPDATTDQAALPLPLSPPAASTFNGALPVNRTKYALPASQYFAREFPKDMIVLHFTAGSNAAGAYNAWISSPLEVATAYLVERDGTIFECFHPKYWAYHLGISGAANAGYRHDKRSIGIEIVNVGPLSEDKANPNQLNWWPNEYRTKWCTKGQGGNFLAASYRQYHYYATYPDPQIAAVKGLVDQLCSQFSIPKRMPLAGKRTEFDMRYFSTFSGVATHQNFRADKFDVGPAFPWPVLGLGE